MLALRNNSRIIERTIKAPNGQFVVATFLVTEIAGKFEVKMLSVRPTESSASTIATAPVTCLPAGRLTQTTPDTKVAFSEAIVSPFFSLDFFMSQPTRAPSF